jgi:hypothetical protein
MDNLLNVSELSPRIKLAASPVGSLLEQCLPGLAGEIELACMGQADLVPYAVRQALNDGLADAQDAAQLGTLLGSMPRSEQTYTRHILHADPMGRFTVVALIWGAQQFSPVHAHHTWCAYRVLEGELTESHYEWDRTAQQAYLFNKVIRTAGQSVCGHAGMELIHRLGNSGCAPAVSIHVYGVDSGRVGSHVNRVLPWAELALQH